MIQQFLSAVLVGNYKVVHGILHLRGAGYPIRKSVRFLPGLQSFPLKLPEGHVIEVDFRDVSATYWLNHLLRDRFEEEGLLAAVVAMTGPETVVWDCGANCGLFSYRLRRETNAREVIFFDPNPAMFKLASEATAPLSRIKGYNLALSDQAGKTLMRIPEGASTTGTLEGISTEGSVGTIEIDCITGDELVDSGLVPIPGIIKIDTEGHELSVIRGLSKIIAEHFPVIFFENLSLSDEEISSNTPAGYRVFTVDDASGDLIQGMQRTKGHNSAFLPEEHSSLLSHVV